MRIKPSYLIAAGIALAISGWLASGQLGAGKAKPERAAAAAQSAAARLPTVRVREVVAEPIQREIIINGKTAPARAVTLRAEFPNPDRFLPPGMYVRARLEQAVNESAITVPQQAVQRDNNGASVMTVGADGKVAPRPIKTGSVQGDKWIVTDGLKEGDVVIVEGLQKVQPGAAVKPVPWKSAPAGSAAAPVAAAPAASAAAPANQK